MISHLKNWEVQVHVLSKNARWSHKHLITFHYRQAGKLAQERGWAINIGGGFHHCSADRGGGFCAYADITLSIHFMFDRLQGISKVLIIDLDAHQVIMLIYYFTIKTMKVWVDMEKFCRDSTKLHFKEAVWIISCWIFFYDRVTQSCIVNESIQILCYWPYKPSCFKYLMTNLYLIQFVLIVVLVHGTDLFVT